MAEQADSLRLSQGQNGVSEATGAQSAQGGNYYHDVYHENWSSPLRASYAPSSTALEYPPLVFDPTISAALPFPGTIASGAYVPASAFGHHFSSQSQPFPSGPTPDHLDIELLDQWLQPEVLYDEDTTLAVNTFVNPTPPMSPLTLPPPIQPVTSLYRTPRTPPKREREYKITKSPIRPRQQFVSTRSTAPMQSNQPVAGSSGHPSSPEEEAQARFEQKRARSRELAALYRLRTKEQFEALHAQALQGEADKMFQVACVAQLQSEIRHLWGQVALHTGCDPCFSAFLAASMGRALIWQCAARQAEGHGQVEGEGGWSPQSGESDD